MKKLLFSAILSLTSLTAIAAGDPAIGEKKAAACVACHGAGGAAPIMPSYPKLAGQYADYLAQALKAYKSGDRKNPVMVGLAAGIADEDIEHLAAYFASQDGLAIVKEPTPPGK